MCLSFRWISNKKRFIYLISLLFIGGAVDIETSEFARVAKIFYNLALKVCLVLCTRIEMYSLIIIKFNTALKIL